MRDSPRSSPVETARQGVEQRHLLAQQHDSLAFRARIGLACLQPGANLDRLIARAKRVLQRAGLFGRHCLCLEPGSAPQQVSM